MSRWLKNNNRDICSLLVLTLIWFLFIRRLLGAEFLAISKDNEFLLAPVLSHMSNVMQAGEWPLWMDTILGGLPLYNLTQLSPAYPFYFTWLPIYGDFFSTARTIHLVILLHLLVFVINAFVLLRVIGVSRIAAVAGATLIVFNANMSSLAGWVNIIAPYAWLPLYLAGLIQLFNAPSSILAAALTLVSIILLTIASPAQPLIHAVFITLVLATAHGVNRLMANEKWQLIKGYVSLAAISVIAMLLTAPVLLPAVTEFDTMLRWVGNFPPVVGNERIPFEAFLTDQITPSSLMQVLFKPDEVLLIGSQYIGLLPVALVAYVLFAKARHWLVLPLTFMALYALLSATGSHLGFAYLNYEIPLINKIREPSRFLFLTHFAVGILVALAIDKIALFVTSTVSSRHSSTSRQRDIGLYASGAVIVCGFIVAVILWKETAHHKAILIALLTTVILFIATVLARYWRQVSVTTSLCFCAAVVLSTQLYMVRMHGGNIAAMDYISHKMVGLDIALQFLAKRDPDRQYRALFEGNMDKQNAAMLASFYGIRSLNAYFNPIPKRQFDELYYHSQRSKNYFAALGAKYILCHPCDPAKTYGYNFVEKVSEFSIYEGDASPRLYIATQIAGEYQDIGDYAQKMSLLDITLNPVLVKKGAWKVAENSPKNIMDDTKLKLISQKNNSVSVMMQTSVKALLVLNEFDNGSWLARINGKFVETLSVNGNQVAVAVPAGVHHVALSYEPRSLKLALRFFIAGLISLCIYGVVLFWLKARTYRS
jgi:hypothetical protein